MYVNQFQVQRGADILVALPGPAWLCCLWTGVCGLGLLAQRSPVLVWLRTMHLKPSPFWLHVMHHGSHRRAASQHVDLILFGLNCKLHSGRSPNALWQLVGMLLLGIEQSQSEIKPPEECRRRLLPLTDLHPLSHYVLNNHSLHDQQSKGQHMGYFCKGVAHSLLNKVLPWLHQHRCSSAAYCVSYSCIWYKIDERFMVICLCVYLCACTYTNIHKPTVWMFSNIR